MADWIFAFFHLFLLIGLCLYAVFSLFQGNVFRFALIIGCLVIYYFIVLHKPVRQEMRRRRDLKARGDKP